MRKRDSKLKDYAVKCLPSLLLHEKFTVLNNKYNISVTDPESQLSNKELF